MAGILGLAVAAEARERIFVVGSSTVQQYELAVSRQLTRSNPRFRTPAIEPGGTSSGIRFFCAGVGTAFPDFVGASRPMRPDEIAFCRRHGVDAVATVKIGYDAIIVARGADVQPMPLTRELLFKAMAKFLPPAEGAEPVPNTSQTWDQIDPALPKMLISVFGPPKGTSTLDTFIELVFRPACARMPEAQALAKRSPAAFRTVCSQVREDAAYSDLDSIRAVAARLATAPAALGLVNFIAFQNSGGRLSASAIDGVEPTLETIPSGAYALGRPLYIYGKVAHVGVIGGVEEFLDELTSERAWGTGGYLAGIGLVPMVDRERAKVRSEIQAVLAR